MEMRDTVIKEEAGGAAPARASIDRFEMKHQWTERTEEELVEAAEALYEKAARQRMQPVPPDILDTADSEELEAMSQELKLQQKCQDIAALILADEQGLMDGEDEEE